MKMAVGAIGRGLLSEESLMSVATGTTKHEKDDGLSIAARLVAGAGNWIPAFAGMTMGWWHDGYFQRNNGEAG